jgi:uncharacterized membrane protein
VSLVTLGAERAPAWEFLLSHHRPERWGRTITLRGERWRLHLCARCTGQVAGLSAYLAILAVGGPLKFNLFAPSIQLVFAIAPLPAAIDWISQSLGHRESTNALRFSSGALLGLAFTDVLALVVEARWLETSIAFLTLTAYIVGLLLVLWWTGGWKKVLAEHFPEVASELP